MFITTLIVFIVLWKLAGWTLKHDPNSKWKNLNPFDWFK